MGNQYTAELNVGDKVTIMCRKKDTCVVPDMLRFHGVTTRISKVHRVKKNNAPNGVSRTYELEGVESPYGIPYLFIKDMLIPNEEKIEWPIKR